MLMGQRTVRNKKCGSIDNSFHASASPVQYIKMPGIGKIVEASVCTLKQQGESTYAKPGRREAVGLAIDSNKHKEIEAVSTAESTEGKGIIETSARTVARQRESTYTRPGRHAACESGKDHICRQLPGTAQIGGKRTQAKTIHAYAANGRQSGTESSRESGTSHRTRNPFPNQEGGREKLLPPNYPIRQRLSKRGKKAWTRAKTMTVIDTCGRRNADGGKLLESVYLLQTPETQTRPKMSTLLRDAKLLAQNRNPLNKNKQPPPVTKTAPAASAAEMLAAAEKAEEKQPAAEAGPSGLNLNLAKKSKPNSAAPGDKEKEKEGKNASNVVGSPEWIAKKKKKNDLRNARKQKRRTQGPLFPFSLKISGPEANSEISLLDWRAAHTAAGDWFADALLSQDRNTIFDIAVEEWKFVERAGPRGVKTANKPPGERMGHGLLLFSNEASKDWAIMAFERVGMKCPESGKEYRPNIESIKADRRAVYTLAVNRYMWGTISVQDKIWRLAQCQYRDQLPDHIGVEMEKALPTDRDPEKAIIVLRLDTAWEKAIDALDGRLRLCIGILNFRKKRSSEGYTDPKKQHMLPEGAYKQQAADKAAAEKSANDGDVAMI